MAYILYVDASGRWYWHLMAADQRIIASSAERYPNRLDCLTAVSLVKGSAGAPVLSPTHGGATRSVH